MRISVGFQTTQPTSGGALYKLLCKLCQKPHALNNGDTLPEHRVPPTCHALPTTTPHPSSHQNFSHPHTLSTYTHAPQTTVHAPQSQQPPHPHKVPRQPNRHTKYDYITTDTLQGHKPSSRSERNIIILQANINGSNKPLEAQNAYSRHTCRYHHNSVNQARP